MRVPRLNWVFRAFYGHYYQPPPLVTATGALFGLANSQNFTFAPLHGERDKQWEASVIIPYRGWNLEVDNYQTNARNWLDHNNIGESNLFWPITWYGALIQGWDLTLRSPDALASRPVPPRLCQSNRAGNLADYRRLDLSRPGDVRLSPRHTAGIFAGRPRSEKHIERGHQYKSSLA